MTMFEKIKESMEIPHRKIMQSTVLCSSFYVLQLLSQRVFMGIGMHSARSLFLISSLGVASTSLNLFLSQMVELNVRKLTSDYGSRRSWWSFPTQKLNTSPSKWKHRDFHDSILRLYLGIGTFILLEQSLFRTAVPSSVIHTGVYANFGNRLYRSIPATSEIVTESQRRQIQILGRKFGCHQCGDRQLFSKAIFIGDHMPPTKFAIERSAALWRKFLRIPVSQRLWAQCQSCFMKQGPAVRIGQHTPIFHKLFRRHHLAPGIAAILAGNKEIVKLVDFIVEPTTQIIEREFRHWF